MICFFSSRFKSLYVCPDKIVEEKTNSQSKRTFWVVVWVMLDDWPFPVESRRERCWTIGLSMLEDFLSSWKKFPIEKSRKKNKVELFRFDSIFLVRKSEFESRVTLFRPFPTEFRSKSAPKKNREVFPAIRIDFWRFFLPVFSLSFRPSRRR